MSLQRFVRFAAPLALAAFVPSFMAACSAATEDDGETTPAVSEALESDGAEAVSPDATTFRALLVMTVPNEAALATQVDQMYKPGSATFRQYLTASQIDSTIAPSTASVSTVSNWLAGQGFKVDRVASNKLLVEFSGTVTQFQKAFDVTLSSTTTAGAKLYTMSGPAQIPTALASLVTTVLTPDLPAATGTLTDTGSVRHVTPGSQAYVTTDLREAYGANELATKGKGETIGIVAGGGIRPSDEQSFWQSLGVTRASATIVTTAVAPAGWDDEATLDVEFSGGMAADANVIVYDSPDIRDTSLVYAFNEAVGVGKATVISDSFSHNEAVESVDVRVTYNTSALLAAAMGTTVLAASGDSHLVDSPSSCPYVTAVGGTHVTLSGGAWGGEDAWSYTGCGVSASFAQPSWQAGKTPGTTSSRAVVDLSAEADTLWLYGNGKWQQYGGTSFASPTTAGLMADVNSARTAKGMTRVGWLNPILYGVTAVQAAMHDITSGSSDSHSAAKGWDNVTGWGSPDVSKLVTAIP